MSIAAPIAHPITVDTDRMDRDRTDRARVAEAAAPATAKAGAMTKAAAMAEGAVDREIHLRNGRCHYRLEGRRDAPLVLLIHGATVPSWQFDRFVPMLHQAGYRTLRLDLYGHGRSAAPKTRYELPLFVEQCVELIERLPLPRRMHVLGYSMGGAVAAGVVAQRPQRFHGVALAAPMLDAYAATPSLKLLRTPLLGECLVPTVVKPMLARRRRANFASLEDGRWVKLYSEQMAQPGFGRALLSLVRCGTLSDQSPRYAALGRTEHPKFVLTGAADPVVALSDVERIHAMLPGATLQTIDDLTHALFLQHPERVGPRFIDFFRRVDSQRSAQPQAAMPAQSVTAPALPRMAYMA